MARFRGNVIGWFLLLTLLISDSLLHSMEPLSDPQRETTTASSGNLSSLESMLRDIGALAGSNRPTCFIARCGTNEDSRILQAHDDIVGLFNMVGIDAKLDSRGDQGGLPYGEDIWSYMEKGIARSNFVLLALTPAGLERSKDGESGYATEIRCIKRRLASATCDEDKRFLIPVLMAGTVDTSVPISINHISVLTATNPNTHQFDMRLFMKEMIPLFRDRFFKEHPRLEEIKSIIANTKMSNQGVSLEVQSMRMEFDEESYRRFLNGKLIYKPDPNSDAGKIEFPIRNLVNPLEGVFDLSQCGDNGKYLSIATGYRKGVKLENSGKIEIWLAPRFLIAENLGTTAKHYMPIMNIWDAAVAPVGIFWNWGGWDNLQWFDYLTTQSFERLSDNNLYQKWWGVSTDSSLHYRTPGLKCAVDDHWNGSLRCNLGIFFFDFNMTSKNENSESKTTFNREPYPSLEAATFTYTSEIVSVSKSRGFGKKQQRLVKKMQNGRVVAESYQTLTLPEHHDF